jgi:hypothetical protein
MLPFLEGDLVRCHGSFVIKCKIFPLGHSAYAHANCLAINLAVESEGHSLT